MAEEEETPATFAGGTKPKNKSAKDKDKEKKDKEKKKKQQKNAEELGIAEFGWSIAFFKSVPELWKKFSQAIDEGWTAARFKAAIMGTKWYKTHADTWRKAYALKYTDPKTYQANRKEIYTTVQQLAGQMGAPLSKAQLNVITGHAMWQGWNEQQMRVALANYVSQIGKDGYDGEAGAAEDEIRSYAQKMGVRLDEKALKSWLGNILRGTRTVEAYKNFIQNQALRAFPSLADQIKGGDTVADIASPYINSMASILELSPTSIDLFDPAIRKAMTYGNGEMMPIWAFENQLRRDPRWMQTNNARTNINSIGLQVLKDFGFQA